MAFVAGMIRLAGRRNQIFGPGFVTQWVAVALVDVPGMHQVDREKLPEHESVGTVGCRYAAPENARK